VDNPEQRCSGRVDFSKKKKINQWACSLVNAHFPTIFYFFYFTFPPFHPKKKSVKTKPGENPKNTEVVFTTGAWL